jgi:Glycosyl hydrolase family 79 C-terminal beta domain
VAGLTGLLTTARRLNRRGALRLVAIGAVLLMLAVLVPVVLADMGQTPAAPARAGHQLGSQSRSPAGRAGRSRRGPAPGVARAALTIAPDPSSAPVPTSFLGLSLEYWELPMFGRNTPVFERLLSLLHVAGDGPLILRIGGDSADQSFWSIRRHKMPDWAFELTPSYLSRLRALVRHDRVKLIVDLNLVTATPLSAAAWARAAETALPHGSIIGFEIGNEPDLYVRRYWMNMIAGSPFQTRALPLDLTPDTYVQDFAAYAGVLGEQAPDIPLVGPATAHPRIGLPFISALIVDQRSELGMVTAHLYQYSGCARHPRQSSYPTVARLLSPRTTWAFAKDISAAVALSHGAGLKFRLTEFNSVNCGGKPGLSNTFATALWAPDALFTAMRTGADGANLHVHAPSVNAAFTINRDGLHPRPLLYGLMLFTRMLGPQARLVRLHLAAARSLDLSAWAVEIKRRILHVLLIDKGRRSVRVALRLPATATGTIQRLVAPSAYSRSGVTLNGQQLNYASEWTGTPRDETIAPGRRGGYDITMYRRSAALVSVRLASGDRVIPARGTASEHHRRVAVT